MSLVSSLSPRAVLRPTSILRQYQDAFLTVRGSAVVGDVVELGGERHYRHDRFFPRASSYTVTNVTRDYDQYVDMTKMPYPDASQQTFVCVSVLEHVDDVDAALSEVRRTLAPGGVLIGVVPFLFPIHDEVDYRRFGPSFFERLKDDFDVELWHLGGRLSTVACLLQRPPGKWDRRHTVYKLLCLFVSVMGRWDAADDSPLGYGFVVTRRPCSPMSLRSQ